MSRNNEDRLTPTTGASQDAATEVPPTTEATGQGAPSEGASSSFVTPTEFVDQKATRYMVLKQLRFDI